MSGEVWQLILAILGISGPILGAYALRIKNQAVAQLEKTKSDLKQIEADTNIRVQKAAEEAAERAFQREQLKQQLKVNEGFQKSLEVKEDRDERNYRHLADTQRDNTQMLMTEIQSQGSAIRQAIQSIPVAPPIPIDTIRTIVMEFANQVTQQMAVQSLNREFLPFPKGDDPGWEDVALQATQDNVVLRTSPQYYDEAKLKAPFGTIHEEPHEVRIIRGRVPGWMIVNKKQNGDPPAYGYVEERLVKVVERQALQLA